MYIVRISLAIRVTGQRSYLLLVLLFVYFGNYCMYQEKAKTLTLKAPIKFFVPDDILSFFFCFS